MNLGHDFHLVDFDYDKDFFSLLERQGEVLELEWQCIRSWLEKVETVNQCRKRTMENIRRRHR